MYQHKQHVTTINTTTTTTDTSLRFVFVKNYNKDTY